MPVVLILDPRDAARAGMRAMLQVSTSLDARVVEAATVDAATAIARGGGIDVAVAAVTSAPKASARPAPESPASESPASESPASESGSATSVADGADVVGWVRALRREREPEALPVLLVVPSADHPARVAGLEAGANDYLVEPYTSGELMVRLQVQLRLKVLQDELRRTAEQQRRLGLHDALTGLANRRHFLQAARRELARSRRHKFSMAVAVVDVDGFHLVNDRVGPLVGDAIIAELAGVLRRDLRSHDFEARLGGARFAAVLPQTDVHQARVVCGRVRESIANGAFAGQAVGSIRASIGIAAYPGGHLESVDELLNAAESAVDRASFKGGNRIEVWNNA